MIPDFAYPREIKCEHCGETAPVRTWNIHMVSEQIPVAASSEYKTCMIDCPECRIRSQVCGKI